MLNCIYFNIERKKQALKSLRKGIIMIYFKVLEKYRGDWGNSTNENDYMLSYNQIVDLSKEWEKPLEELLEEVEPCINYEINDIIPIMDLLRDAEISIDYLIEEEVYNLEIGEYSDILHGSKSIPIDGTNDYFNIIFETYGNYTVIDNSDRSNINLTKIDKESLTVKITNIEVI